MIESLVLVSFLEDVEHGLYEAHASFGACGTKRGSDFQLAASI